MKYFLICIILSLFLLGCSSKEKSNQQKDDEKFSKLSEISTTLSSEKDSTLEKISMPINYKFINPSPLLVCNNYNIFNVDTLTGILTNNCYYLIHENKLKYSYNFPNCWIETLRSTSDGFCYAYGKKDEKNSLILVSNDNCQNWEKIKLSEGTVVVKVFFLNKSLGWFVSQDSCFEINTNELTVKSISKIPINIGWQGGYQFSSYNDCEFYFSSENIGFLYTHSSPYEFYRTFDGGRSWWKTEIFDLKAFVFLYSMVFMDSINGYIRCEIDNKECLLSTKDGGNTWINFGPLNTKIAQNMGIINIYPNFNYNKLSETFYKFVDKEMFYKQKEIYYSNDGINWNVINHYVLYDDIVFVWIDEMGEINLLTGGGLYSLNGDSIKIKQKYDKMLKIDQVKQDMNGTIYARLNKNQLICSQNNCYNWSLFFKNDNFANMSICDYSIIDTTQAMVLLEKYVSNCKFELLILHGHNNWVQGSFEGSARKVTMIDDQRAAYLEGGQYFFVNTSNNGGSTWKRSECIRNINDINYFSINSEGSGLLFCKEGPYTNFSYYCKVMSTRDWGNTWTNVFKKDFPSYKTHNFDASYIFIDFMQEINERTFANHHLVVKFENNSLVKTTEPNLPIFYDFNREKNKLRIYASKDNMELIYYGDNGLLIKYCSTE